MYHSRNVLYLALTLLCLTATSSQTALAVDWNAGTGNWNVGGNWVGGSVPSGVIASIENGGTAQITGAVPNVAGINVGATAATNGFVEQTAGSITSTTHVEVGRFGMGEYTMSGGSLTVNNGVINVGGVTGTGVFNMSGAGTTITISNDRLLVGEVSTGTFNMTGGTINQSGGETQIGANAGGNGTFNQSGGTLNANNYMHVGRLGSVGLYNMSGPSTINVANRLMVGENGNGTFNMSGGTLKMLNSSLNTFHVGAGGPASLGVFSQSDGDVTSGGLSLIGSGAGTNGTYNLSGGTLSFTQTGTDALQIGNDSSLGTFNQSGGSFTSNGWVHVGRLGGTGVYNLSGGSFSIPTAGKSLFIGESGNGTLNIYGSAATMNVRNFVLQDAGDTLRYTLTNTGATQIMVTDNITHFDGNLDVDLAGGAALLTSPSHTLISGTAILNGGDNSIFSETLWTKTNPGGNTVQVDLAVAAEKPTVNGTGETGPFAGSNSGWIEITGQTPGQPLLIDLDVETNAALGDLVSFLNDNGHDAGLSNMDGFDLSLRFQATASALNFAWDFSDFDAIGNTTTTVQNIGVNLPEPGSMLAWSLIGLVLGGYGYRRMRRYPLSRD